MKHSKMNLIVNTRDDDRWSKDLVVVRDVLERDAYKLNKLSSLITPRVILDIGGHIGSFSLKAKTVWPNAQIFAFEPNVKNAHLYQRNVLDNKFTGVKVFNEAISYEKDKVVLTDHLDATGGGFLCAQDKVDKLGSYFVSRTDVALSTLEEIMVRENIEYIDLLKLDCEGSEREIIRQMLDETVNKIGMIVGEYHIEGGYPKFSELFYSRFKHLELIRTDPSNTRNIGEFLAVPKVLRNKF